MPLLIQTYQLLVSMTLLSLALHFNVVSKDSQGYQKKLDREFKDSRAEPHVGFVKYQNRTLRYVDVNQAREGAPVFIFVHGAPGGADAFFSYLKDSTLFTKARMISVDRLGYAGSSEGGAEPSIIEQANAIQPLVEELAEQGRSVYLIGHSYGGPVIGRLAMQLPTRVSGLMMLAPAIDPENEKMFWFAKWGIKAPTKWITPKPMRVAAHEKLGHIQALKEIESDWSKIQCEVIHMHGDRDMLVPFINLAFAQREMKQADFRPVVLKGENHFLPWTQKKLITDVLLEWLE